MLRRGPRGGPHRGASGGVRLSVLSRAKTSFCEDAARVGVRTEERVGGFVCPCCPVLSGRVFVWLGDGSEAPRGEPNLRR
jgi:hypothetical protein